MAAVSSRALCVLRFYEVSRVITVSSALANTHKYRNETWCRRWWHISQRNLSLTTKCFAPNLTPILTKGVADPKTSTQPSTPTTKAVPPKTVDGANPVTQSTKTADVTVTYHGGLPRITVPLPSRNERCIFTLKPITHTVGDFINMLKREDRGIDRAIVLTDDPSENIRISSSTSIESLVESPFRLQINDNEYVVVPPVLEKTTSEDLEKLSDLRVLVGQLYEALQVREHNADMEQNVLAELEDVRIQLEPLEQKLQELEVASIRRANMFVWSCLVLMAVQFGGLARLTWWEYSWDIMEPVTYFVTYGTTMACVIYFLLTKQEYMLPDVFHRRQLIAIHKRARRAGLDLNVYNALKDREYELLTTLNVIRGPLYEHKLQQQQKKKHEDSSSESSSSSSSPSPSPSPSPSRRPSPEKCVPNRIQMIKTDVIKELASQLQLKFSQV